MRKIGQDQPKIENTQSFDCDLVFISPPIAKSAKKYRYAERKVVKSHHQQIVIGINKTNQPQNQFCLIHNPQEIYQRQWQSQDTQTQYNFFTYQRWEKIHQESKQKVASPVGKGRQIELVNVANSIVLMVVIFLEHLGVVDVTRSILRREIGHDPNWQQMYQQQ